jgi:glucose-1-phosphate thymidylyltransferase
MDASQFVHVVQQRQGHKIGCVEEVAWRNGWLSDNELRRLAVSLSKSGYGSYLQGLLADGRGQEGG